LKFIREHPHYLPLLAKGRWPGIAMLAGRLFTANRYYPIAPHYVYWMVVFHTEYFFGVLVFTCHYSAVFYVYDFAFKYGEAYFGAYFWFNFFSHGWAFFDSVISW